MTLRLIGYARVSTEEQARDGKSLLIQPQQMRAYCALYGYELVDVVTDEGVSASVDFERRPGAARIMERLRSGEADGVVCQRIDRMFRLTLDGLQTFAWFDRRGLSVHSVSEKIDTESPEGKMTLTLLLATAEYERNKIAQRAREVSRGLREQGRVYGPVPFGLVEVDGLLYRDPVTWAVRERIRYLREAQGMSLRAIERQLRAERAPTPGGGRQWHVSTIRHVLNTHHDLEHIPLLDSGNEPPVSPAPASLPGDVLEIPQFLRRQAH